ncbi:MAG: hypothetical protein M1347_08205 [Chloroflexi bacterium]|nr:hypothetical protein [Chloroflexota bacterium]
MLVAKPHAVVLQHQLLQFVGAEAQFVCADGHQLVAHVQAGRRDPIDAARSNQDTQMVGQVLEQVFDEVHDLLVFTRQVVIVQDQQREVLHSLLDLIDKIDGQRWCIGGAADGV